MNTPQLYMFDMTTGEYTGSRDATQRYNGDFIIEATGATSVAPPSEIAAGHVARWTGNVWDLVEDHRQHMDEQGRKQGGTQYWMPDDIWQSQPRYMTELGPLPEGALLERPEKPLEIIRSEKLSSLRSAFASAEANGHLTSVCEFEIDATERANRDISVLIMFLEATGTSTTTFCDYTNTFRQVTIENLKTMQLEVITYRQALYSRKWSLRTTINNAQTKEELEAIKISFDVTGE